MEFRYSRVDRKSTRLNSSHHRISYAVFCLKKFRKSASKSGCRFVDGCGKRLRLWTTHAQIPNMLQHCINAFTTIASNSTFFFIFFLKYGGTPEVYPFPPPAPLE